MEKLNKREVVAMKVRTSEQKLDKDNEVKDLFFNTIRGMVDDNNVRNHLNFETLQAVPKTYKDDIGTMPFVTERRYTVSMVPTSDLYEKTDFLHKLERHYFKDTSNVQRKVLLTSAGARIPSAEVFSYLKRIGLWDRILPNNNSWVEGKAGKMTFRNDEDIPAIFHAEDGTPCEVKYGPVDCTCERSFDNDSLKMSIPVITKGHFNDSIYIPQLWNPALAIGEAYNWLDTHYALCVMREKANVEINHEKRSVNRFYAILFKFEDMYDISSRKVVDSICFTFDKDDATAFDYFDKNGRQLYTEAQLSFVSKALKADKAVKKTA